MKTFGFFSLALAALSFLLWLFSFAYWNFVWTIGETWSNTYILMLGVTLLAGICGFLALFTISIGLIIGPKGKPGSEQV